MEYIIAKTNEINPGIDSAEWEKATLGHINNCSQWPTSECVAAPNTTFKLLRGPEGISILMHTDETHLRSEVKVQNGPICTDSCMEFFLKPSPWDVRYINFEVNPDGIMHIGIGKDRYGREMVEEDRATFDVVSIANEGDWTLKYYIPYTFIEKLYPELEKLSRGNSCNIMRGNFYKCGDNTDHPHLASWAEIKTANSDFHVPDFFGRIIF